MVLIQNFYNVLMYVLVDYFYAKKECVFYTLSSPYRFKPNRPLPVFSLTVGVDDIAKVAGIWNLRVPRPSGQETGHISNRHVIPNQVLVVFKGNFHITGL